MADDDKALVAGATAVTTVVIEALRDSDGLVHSETAITAIAATAGTLLLRQALPAELDGLEPGSVVLVDELNEQGMDLLGVAIDAAVSLGIEWDASGEAVPDEHQPHEQVVDLVHKLEAQVVATLTEHNVDRSLWSKCCILSAVDLVHRTREVLDPTIATGVITEALVAGTKTVPYPVSSA